MKLTTDDFAILYGKIITAVEIVIHMLCHVAMLLLLQNKSMIQYSVIVSYTLYITGHDPEKYSLSEYLETMLTSGRVNKDVVCKYPELDNISLFVQVEMFKNTYKENSLHETKLAYRSMEPARSLLVS